ncbi:MAG: hypothetical protein ABIJ83_03465 [Patescibacteria group bacterium]
MIDIFFSVLILFVSITIPILCGFLFFNLNQKKLEVKDLPLYPFIGLSIIILILQNLVYLNIPLKYTSWPFIGIILILFVIKLATKRIKFKNEFIYLFIAITITFIVNGVGYMRETANWYIGYGWQDQYNYTATAEFLKEYPFKTQFKDIDTPYLIQGILKKGDRIGQSIFQAFLATVTNTSSDIVYGAVSLLAPILTLFSFLYVFSIFKIKKSLSYILSTSASFIPATSAIHLECFLSQALGTPFIIITLAYIFTIDFQNNLIKKIIILSLLVAASNSIYTEFTPIILVGIAITLLFSTAHLSEFKKIVPPILSSLFLSIFLNPLYFESTLKIFQRTNLSDILSHVYPFSNTIYGYNRLYFGDLSTTNNVYYFYFVIVIYLFSNIGLLLDYFKKNKAITFIIFGLLNGSLFLHIFLKNYPYQTYKFLLSFYPLFFIGFGLFINYLMKIKQLKIFSIVLLFVTTLIPLYATLNLSNMAYLGNGRSIKSNVNTKEHRKNYEKLLQLENKDIFLEANHPYELARLAYYGRKNRLWFLNPILGDQDTETIPSFYNTNLNNMPLDTIKISGIISIPKSNSVPGVYGSINGSIEGIEGNLWTWLGKEMSMKIFSQKKQNIHITFGVNRGPANADNKRTLRITNLTTAESKEITFIESKSHVDFEFYVIEGYNNFKLETIYPEKIEYIPNNDRRIFMIMINNMSIN